MKILLKAGIKRQIKQISALIIIFTIMTASVIIAVSIKENSQNYISSEMDRAGFGDAAIWLGFSENNSDELVENIVSNAENMKDVSAVEIQKLIFSGYSVGEKRSDNEGQLILFEPDENKYRFLNGDLSGYADVSKIDEGTIYVSPSMASEFGAYIGDVVTFRLSRNGVEQSFVVAGYFEDPFMGSSMIDMKGFLIGEADFEKITTLLNETDAFNVLGRSGVMMHVYQSGDSTLTPSEFAGAVRSGSGAEQYTEFSYSKENIYGFMMILQNIMAGFLLVFAIVSGIICVLILSHGISSSIEQEYKDIGILKTVGAKGGFLRKIQLLQYLTGIILGMAAGILVSFLLGNILKKQMVWSAGLLIPSTFPWGKLVFIFLGIIIFFIVFIYAKTKKVLEISPINAIRGNMNRGQNNGIYGKISEKNIYFSYAMRQVRSSKKRYAGIVIVAALLVSLAVIVGKLNLWLGSNGEGLMNSFSVAEHDIGVQPNHEMDMSEVEQLIEQYASIEDTYELAMQSGTVQGVDYTLNVLDEPEWFHIISGRACTAENEIVVTEYVAEDLGVSIGDKVIAGAELGNYEYTIVGIYACANEMGANVGLTREGYAHIGNVNGYIWCTHYILSTPSFNEEIMTALQNRYIMDMDVHTNSWLGLDGIVSTMKLLTVAMYGIVFIIILVVVWLTSSRFLQAEQVNTAILKSQGFSVNGLRITFSLRFVISAFAGVILGSTVSMAVSDKIASVLLKSFGISDFHTSFSVIVNIVLPLIILFLFAAASYISAGKIKKVRVRELLGN